jgi:hypothetical protein
LGCAGATKLSLAVYAADPNLICPYSRNSAPLSIKAAHHHQHLIPLFREAARRGQFTFAMQVPIFHIAGKLS